MSPSDDSHATRSEGALKRTHSPPSRPSSSAAEDAVEPLGGKLSRAHLTVGNGFLDDYEAARAALSHSNPGAYRVEIDHIIPRAAGGPSTVENCRLACKSRNLLAARRFFGDAWMDRYTGRKRSARQHRAGAAAGPGNGSAGQPATAPCGRPGGRSPAPPVS